MQPSPNERLIQFKRISQDRKRVYKINMKRVDLIFNISETIVLYIHLFSSEELANIAYAYAKIEYPQPILFDTIATEAIPTISNFNSQGLVNIASAFEKSKHNHQRFQDAYSEDNYPELIGECKDGEATVSIYLQDISLPDGNNVPIPSMCNLFNTDHSNTKRVAYHFRLPCNSLCVEHEDHLDKAPAPTKPNPTTPITPTLAPTFTSTLENQCDKAIVIGYENFESVNQDSWNGAIVSNDPALTWFLGRMGKQNSHADKTYIVPPHASSITVEFTMYEIDEWEIDDKFTVIINSRRIDLGHFHETDVVGNPFNFKSGSKAGIIWLQYCITPAMKVAFNSSYADQAHKVEMCIPHSYYLDEVRNM